LVDSAAMIQRSTTWTPLSTLALLLRDRRYATLPSAGAAKHSKTTVDPCGSVQSESNFAEAVGSRYPAGAEKPHWAGVFATFARSAEPDDGRFATLAAYSPGWPPDSTHFSLPHTSSSLTHSESFRHGLLRKLDHRRVAFWYRVMDLNPIARWIFILILRMRRWSSPTGKEPFRAVELSSWWHTFRSCRGERSRIRWLDE
jgi:hypothetical protein